MTDEDGPGKGDRTLLKAMLAHQIVLKPLENTDKNENNKEILTSLVGGRSLKTKIKQKPPLIQMIERAATMRFLDKAD